jgi:hypothetical protein
MLSFVVVDNLMVSPAEQDEVLKSVPLLGSLGLVIAGGIGFLALDMADFPDDRTTGLVHQGTIAAWKRAAVPGDGKEPLDRWPRRFRWSSHPIHKSTWLLNPTA